jgi:hypothetical protein
MAEAEGSMTHYLYHMLFEPVSAWEKAKFDMLGTGLVLVLIGAAFGIYCIIDSLKGGQR